MTDATDATDATLLQASREGDTDAFAALVERYQRLACAVTYSATGDRTLSEDLAQEAFILAWQRRDELEDPERFAPWLCGVARNLGRNARRKGRREVATADVDLSMETEPDAESRLDDAAAEAAMWQALEAIPDTYREPLVLFYREGQSTKQVAAALGLSPSAVEQRLSRGRKHLRADVEKRVAAGLARTGAPAAGFVAGVMTAIAALPAQAEGAEGKPASPNEAPISGSEDATVTGAGASAGLPLLVPTLLVGLLVALGLAGVMTAGEESVEPDSVASPLETPENAEVQPVDPSRFRSDDLEDVRHRRAQIRAEAERGDREHSPAVTRYMLSRVHARQVAVDLAGGESSLRFPVEFGLTPPRAESPVRTWRGRVLGADGHGVADAVVLAGDAFRTALDSSVTARYGATTQPDGSFVLELASTEALRAMALVDSETWSPVVAIPAGGDDLSLDLTVGPTAILHGTLRREGEASGGRITLTRGEHLRLTFMADLDGHYEIEALPPGRYDVLATDATSPTETGGTAARTYVELAAGERVELDLELPVGSLLAFDLHPPRDLEFTTITYFVVRGQHAIDDVDTLREVMEPLPVEHKREILHGGIDLDDPAQFRDMPSGPATTCIHLVRIEQPSRTEVPVHFACREVIIEGPGTVTPVVFRW